MLQYQLNSPKRTTTRQTIVANKRRAISAYGLSGSLFWIIKKNGTAAVAPWSE